MFIVLFAAGQPSAAPPIKVHKSVDSSGWEPVYIERCADKLRAQGYYSKYTLHRKNRIERLSVRDGLYCHTPQAISVDYGPTGVDYLQETQLTCAMALTLMRFEEIAHEEARVAFNSDHMHPVWEVRHRGTYTCRRLRRKTHHQSQHSFGNAIDLRKIRIKGWGWVDVKRHWHTTRERYQPARQFLRRLVQRLRDEGLYSNVIGPDDDYWHNDHIHLDLAPVSRGRLSPALERLRQLPDM